MVSIENVERGVARFLDEVFLPSFQKDGVKGYALGVAATLLVKRGGTVLREYAKNPLLQQMGLVSADGSVDIDAIREALIANTPAAGVEIDLPLGVRIRLHTNDIEMLYKAIREEARV